MAKIRNHRPSLVGFAPYNGAPKVSLKPGLNLVDDEVMEKQWENAQVQALFERVDRQLGKPILELLEGDTFEKHEMPNDLSTFKSIDARSLIKDSDDVDLLQKWKAANDVRQTVCDALEKRISELTDNDSEE